MTPIYAQLVTEYLAAGKTIFGMTITTAIYRSDPYINLWS